jgi:hypothetical protein
LSARDGGRKKESGGREEPQTLVSRFLRFLGMLAVLTAFINALMAFHAAWEIKCKVDGAEQELARARERNEVTRRQIGALQTNPGTREKIRLIRYESKPGEEILPPR